MKHRYQRHKDRCEAGFLQRPFAALWPALLFLFVVPGARAAPFDVAIVLGGETESYTLVAQRIDRELVRRGLGRPRLVAIDKLTATGRPDVIVTVGLKATQSALSVRSNIPVISTLIPEAGFRAVTRASATRPSAPATAIYLDQPVGRQLDLLQAVRPDSKRVGVLLGPQSAALLPELQAEARRRGLQLNVARIGAESELFPELDGMLRDVDVLLSIPDQIVFNSQTIPSILFNAYRYRVPVIGFSQAYVRAGALAAVFSTPEQLADNVVEFIVRYSDNSKKLPAPGYSEHYSVAINPQVARSFGFALESEARIAGKLRAGSIRP